MKPRFLIYDNLDDRREIYHLLARLSPMARVQFLHWACNHATVPNCKTRPGVSRKTYDQAKRARWDNRINEQMILDLYMDVWALSTQYNLEIDVCLKKLVEMVEQESRKASGRVFSF